MTILAKKISRRKFLKLLCATTTVFLFARLMQAVAGKGYSYSSDTIELQRLIDMASLIAERDNEVVLQRNYTIDNTIYVKSNITIRGSLPNAGTTITMSNINDNGSGKYIFSGRSVENVKLINITFDLNLTAQQVDFRGTESSPIKNVIVQDCVFKRLGKKCWGLVVDYDYPQKAAPSNYNQNILVKNCLFDGTGAKGGEGSSLELVIFSNCRSLKIIECIFQHVPSKEKDAGLAIYGYCENVIIRSNKFLSNVSDMYIQQSKSVLVENNCFGGQVRIMDSRLITICNNYTKNIQIIDFDSPEYDSNPSRFRGSRDITISNNTMNTGLFQQVRLSTNNRSTDNAVEILLHNNFANSPKNIEISGNQVICYRAFIVMTNMRQDSKDYLDNLKIWNNSVSMTSAFRNKGIIELHANSDVPKQGLNNCSIKGNYFARSSVSYNQLPWDVLATPRGVSGLFVDSTNNFNNLGVKR
jgi:hypothetical protein